MMSSRHFRRPLKAPFRSLQYPEQCASSSRPRTKPSTIQDLYEPLRQPSLSRERVKRTLLVRQQVLWRVKLDHLPSTQHQDAVRLQDRIHAVPVSNMQHVTLAGTLDDTQIDAYTYAIVSIVTCANCCPRMISCIALSVSRSTADVAGTHTQCHVDGAFAGLNVPSSNTRIFDFRNSARAKHSNCLCPADKDDPPSLTVASNPPCNVSTNAFR